MEPCQTKPRRYKGHGAMKRRTIPLLSDTQRQTIEDRAWASVLLCSIALIALLFLSSYGYIPSFASGFAMGITTLNLCFSLYAATGTR